MAALAVDSAGGGFVREVRFPDPESASGYAAGLPVVSTLLRRGSLALRPGATFFVGENGTGKSTLVEAFAVAAGFNAEGGSRNFRFSTRASESSLGEQLTVSWGSPKPRDGFFLRAESYYNVATEIEHLDEDLSGPLSPAYGGKPHERSHGESFLALLTHRFRGRSLFVLDEPEAALSVRGALAMLSRMAELLGEGCQFLVATHSPVLLALPGATILEIGDDGSLDEVDYDMALPVQMTRAFLKAPERFLRHLAEGPEA